MSGRYYQKKRKASKKLVKDIKKNKKWEYSHEQHKNLPEDEKATAS